MFGLTKTKIRRLNIAVHRDLGYFFSSLIVVYCISGIALNHVDDWNPDFIVTKDTIHINRTYSVAEITKEKVKEFNALVGESDCKIFDFPTSNQVKIYYKDASLHINLETKKGLYERLSKRPVFYQSNVLHRNSLNGWKWASDVFAFLLIVITITGLFVLKGKYGITRRGKWLIGLGLLPPLIAITVQALQ